MRTRTFSGGIHPPEFKELTEHLPLELMPPTRQVAVPLAQSLGKPAKALVKKGSEVKTGTLLAEADGFISAPVHSPVTGKVVSIAREVSSNGYLHDVVIIQPAADQETDFFPPLDPRAATTAQLLERVQAAGIVGQGGAAFPTFVKLSPPKDKNVDSLVINACECEPYLTRDYRLMLERAADLLEGARIIMKILGVQKCLIGVEDNKPEAIHKLREIAGSAGIEIVPLKTKYPQGGEKMLIKALLDREVPPGKLPLDVGTIVQNVGTAIAVRDAVVRGEPAITAVLTVSGKGIRNPRNLVVPVGTAVRDVIEFCGGIHDNAVRIVVGGPMMGASQHTTRTPVVKATSGILVLTEEEINKAAETTCLKCGRCVSLCALNLLPGRLARLSRLGRLEEAEKLSITACMECGTCAYECPAHIPLVQWIRLGKQAVLRMQRARN